MRKCRPRFFYDWPLVTGLLSLLPDNRWAMTRIRGGGEFDFRGAWKAKAEFFACISFQKSLWIKNPDFYFSGKFAGRKRLSGKEFQHGSWLFLFINKIFQAFDVIQVFSWRIKRDFSNNRKYQQIKSEKWVQSNRDHRYSGGDASARFEQGEI